MTDLHPALPRRTFLAAACASICLAVAGCSSARSAGDKNSSGPTRIPSNDVPVGGGLVLADQQLVVTQPEPGIFHAFSATCTHQGCTVTEVRGAAIICPCHGSHFDITDGAVVRGPARTPLPARTVTLDADTLMVT